MHGSAGQCRAWRGVGWRGLVSLCRFSLALCVFCVFVLYVSLCVCDAMRPDERIQCATMYESYHVLQIDGCAIDEGVVAACQVLKELAWFALHACEVVLRAALVYIYIYTYIYIYIIHTYMHIHTYVIIYLQVTALQPFGPFVAFDKGRC